MVHLATTNFPEKLDERILGRPSRIDEIVRLPLPAAEVRQAYLSACAPELPEDTISRWVADTDNMNFGHLRELVVATQALGCDYDDTIKRLRSINPAQTFRPKRKRSRDQGNTDFLYDDRGAPE